MATIGFHAVRLGLRAAEAFSPELAGRWAERLFFTPPQQTLAPVDGAALATARPFEVWAEGRRIRAWRWGDGPPVVLVHGWGGRGGRFSAFVPGLLAAGFSPVTYDGPGHGATGGGRSSAPQLARALGAVVEAVGAPQALIAHSLGGTVAALALRDGLAPRRVVLLAPVANAVWYVNTFANMLNIGPGTIAAMRRRSERRIRFRWEDLPVPPIVARSTIPALVFHDRGDETVPVAEGQAIAHAWPGSQFVVTQGLGHRGILRDAGVVARAVAFATES